MADENPGFVLPEQSTPSTEAQVFGSFPGRYVAGEPVAAEHLPYADAEEAAAAVADAGLPLEPVVVPEGEGAMPPDANRVENEDEANARLAAEADAERSSRVDELTALNRKQLDKQAADAGVADPGELASKLEVAEAIVRAEAAVRPAVPEGATTPDTGAAAEEGAS